MRRTFAVPFAVLLLGVLSGLVLANVLGQDELSTAPASGTTTTEDGTTTAETPTATTEDGTTAETPTTTTETTTTEESGVDISGPCDEAEHTNDPRCTGAAEQRRDDRRGRDGRRGRDDRRDDGGRVDNSGPGSANSGPGNAEDRGDDRRGRGRGRGRGGDDD